MTIRVSISVDAAWMGDTTYNIDDISVWDGERNKEVINKLIDIAATKVRAVYGIEESNKDE